MQLENLCAAMKDANDVRKITMHATKTPDSQINKYFGKKRPDAMGDSQGPRNGWGELLLSGHFPSLLQAVCSLI